MDKRGFLFTIISLIMLISILAFVIAYQNRIKELQDADTVNILRYYEDDIVSNSYSDLMDINVVNISKKTNTLVNFSSLGKYALDRDNQGIMNNYRNFIIDNYSRLNNINISMDNFVPEFYVKPYNSKFSLDAEDLVVLNPNYSQIQRINIDIKVNETLDLEDDGIARKGLIIRHLVLPNGISGTSSILKFIKDEISPDTYISLMDQYHPSFKAMDYPLISRRLKEKEYEEACNIMFEMGLKNGWMQDDITEMDRERFLGERMIHKERR